MEGKRIEYSFIPSCTEISDLQGEGGGALLAEVGWNSSYAGGKHRQAERGAEAGRPF